MKAAIARRYGAAVEVAEVESGALKPKIYKAYPLADVVDAFAAHGRAPGRIVVEIS